MALSPLVLQSSRIIVLNAWRTSTWLEHLFNDLLFNQFIGVLALLVSTTYTMPPPYETKSVKAGNLESDDLIIV
jgi:hypothetical protein